MKENKGIKEVKGLVRGEIENKKGVDKMDKGVDKMDKGVDKMDKGVDKMDKGVKELVREIEKKEIILIEKVFKWVQTLCPIRDIHVKIKGRFYPLIEKGTSKLYLIDKVQSRKIPFDTLEDKNMKFVILSVLAERKEQIEKEVEEDKKKYLEGKLQEIDKLLSKF